MPVNVNTIGSWSVLGQTQAAATAIVVGIPPYLGPREAPPRLFTVDTSQNWTQPATALVGMPIWWNTESCYTKVTEAMVATGNTSHSIYFLRPKNFTYTTAATPANNAILNLKEDPGVYSTKYRYPARLATGTAAVADNNIAANDYLAYQLIDGTWVFDKVSSVGAGNIAITMTTSTPNVTGGGVAANTAVFFFGAAADKDPATGAVDPAMVTAVNSTYNFESLGALASTLHRGDPMIVYDANATGADTIMYLAGLYAKDW